MAVAGKVVVPIADARSTVHPWAFENKAGKCFTSINVIIESFGLGFAEKKKLSEKDKKVRSRKNVSIYINLTCHFAPGLAFTRLIAVAS